MSLVVRAACPGCGLNARVPASTGRLRCPRCGSTFSVAAAGPGTDAPPTESEAPAAPTAPTRAEGEAAHTPATAPEEAVPDALGAATDRSSRRAEEWRVGDRLLGLYEVTGVLGQGGMGRVYKVRHLGWGVDLAVKTPLPEVLAAVGGASSFELEAETWVGLGLHPHVVSCYYVRRIDGLPRVFAEYVDGGSLHDWIQKRRLQRLEDFLDVAIQFAWGLHYAHEQGLVHKDVKPANVLLDAAGTVKVTDFGLARAQLAGVAGVAASGATLVVAGGAAGTPAYVSPEQAARQPLTRRSDLWSWALSVLEMFHGGRSWQYGGGAAEVLEQHLREGPLEASLPRLPEAVAALLRRCFRHDPAARPHDLGAVAEELRTVYAAIAGQPHPREAPRAGVQRADSLNNRAVSLVDLGRTEEALGLWQQACAAEPHHVEATYNAAVFEWSRCALRPAEALGRLQEVRRSHPGSPRALHLLGRVLLACGEADQAVTCLAQAVSAGAGPDAARDRLLAALAGARDVSDIATWDRLADELARRPELDDVDPVFAVAYALALQRAGRGREAEALVDEVRARHPKLPPAPEAAAALLLAGFEAPGNRWVADDGISCLAVSPDGRLVAAGTAAGSIRLWAVESGSAVRTLEGLASSVRALAFDPSGRSIAWAGDVGAPRLVALGSGPPPRSPAAHGGFTNALAFTPRGDRIVTAGSDRMLRVLDFASGRLVFRLEGHAQAVTCVAIAADGSRAVSGSLDGTLKLWDLAAGRCLASTEQRSAVTAVVFPPAGPVCSGEDGVILRFSPDLDRVQGSLRSHSGPVTALAVDRSGRILVSAGADRLVQAAELERGELRALAWCDAAVPAVVVGLGGVVLAAVGRAVQALPLLAQQRCLPPLAVCRPVTASEAESRESGFRGRVEQVRRLLAGGDTVQALEQVSALRRIPGYERHTEALELWARVLSFFPRKGLRAAWESRVFEADSAAVVALGVASDGALASGSADGTVRVWDVATGRCRRELRGGHRQMVAAVATLPSGGLVSAGRDRTLCVWSAHDPRPRRFQGHDDSITGGALSAAGEALLTSSADHTLCLWDLAQGASRAVLAMDATAATCVAVSPDGGFAVSGGWDGRLRVFDLGSFVAIGDLVGHEPPVTAVAVAPDGRQVASADQSGQVRLWDLERWRCARALASDGSEVAALAFSPDARCLAAASKDKQVRLVLVPSGTALRTLGHAAAVHALAFSAGGDVLYAGTADGRIVAWWLDWEPDTGPGAEAERRLGHFVEVFLAARSAPVRGLASLSEHEIAGLRADLQRRGLGAVDGDTLVRVLLHKLRGFDGQTSFCATLRRRPAAQAAPAVAPLEKRSLPWWRVGLIAVALTLFTIGIAAWLPQRFFSRARVSLYGVNVYLKELRLFRLTPGGAGCRPDEAMAGAVRGEVGPLQCLLASAAPDIAARYLRTLLQSPEPEPEGFGLERTERGTVVSFLYALSGKEAARVTEAACAAVAASGRASIRAAAAEAAGLIGIKEAKRCLLDAARGPDARTRAIAARGIPGLIVSEGIGIRDAFRVTEELTHDADPTVRLAAVDGLSFFDRASAEPAATRLQADTSAEVARAARSLADKLQGFERAEAVIGLPTPPTLPPR